MSAQPSTPRESVEAGAPLLSPVASVRSSSLPLSVPPKNKPWLLLVALVFAAVAVIDVGANLAEPPKTRVFEASLCLTYYRRADPSAIGSNGDVPEGLCKVDEVQQKLAMIFGWQDTFDSIPGIVMAVPLGALADKIGRKWIFASGLLGLQLNSAWILLICE